MKKYLQIQGDLVDDCVEYIKKEYKVFILVYIVIIIDSR